LLVYQVSMKRRVAGSRVWRGGAGGADCSPRSSQRRVSAGSITASWPSGEFGGMGIEGAIRLGYRKELEAVEDPMEREALFRKMVDATYEEGRALNIA
ncbi:hypothetical protein, partial [Acinetobacter baumannii]|uniref:hypothetical protein n=1 Tax=Acinetobacter baumannii TaxID=470 RepID=UPI003AFA160E